MENQIEKRDIEDDPFVSGAFTFRANPELTYFIRNEALKRNLTQTRFILTCINKAKKDIEEKDIDHIIEKMIKERDELNLEYDIKLNRLIEKKKLEIENSSNKSGINQSAESKNLSKLESSYNHILENIKSILLLEENKRLLNSLYGSFISNGYKLDIVVYSSLCEEYPLLKEQKLVLSILGLRDFLKIYHKSQMENRLVND